MVRARASATPSTSTSRTPASASRSDALPKLARPFEWVNDGRIQADEGSGLGLAIARSLAELHGGGLRIRSCEGIGTIVLVQLPVKPQTGLEIVSAARH